MVGVDELRHNGWVLYGVKVKNCHLVCTPDAIASMHTLAASIGLKREWFQEDRVPHYDLVGPKRQAAVEAGAAELDTGQFLEIMRQWPRYGVR